MWGGYAMSDKLTRTTFRTSRLLDFLSEKELVAQTGHAVADWPLVVLKELVDNALDACEDAGVRPEIGITVDNSGIAVSDNGPGIPKETVEGVLDFGIRVSNREAYVAPDRGAQGNALKTVVAVPFVLDGSTGAVEIAAGGLTHRVQVEVDRIQQKPVVEHEETPVDGSKGTTVRLVWPDSACSILEAARDRFLQLAEDFTWLNPHLSLDVDWFGEGIQIPATGVGWRKWTPGDPTSPHWYTPEHLGRLVSAYLAHDEERGKNRTVREFVAEFRGLSGTAKQKAVLDATGLSRTNLSALMNGRGLDAKALARLLAAMKERSKPVPPKALGVIGRDHLAARFEAIGSEMESFDYKKMSGETDGLPWVVETAFAWCPQAERRRIVTGVNWSPGIINPFRQLGKAGRSLDTILAQQRATADEPLVLVLHMACPRVAYTDRGKSAVVIPGGEED